jgi:anaerobic ribonucleoside-triphosphate reductase activating protein
MGGEPMCEENTFLTYLVVSNIKQKLPNTKIYLWTGYYYEDLIQLHNPRIKQILEFVDVVIDGPYVEELRDITLPMRGSSNQSIIELTKE